MRLFYSKIKIVLFYSLFKIWNSLKIIDFNSDLLNETPYHLNCQNIFQINLGFIHDEQLESWICTKSFINMQKSKVLCGKGTTHQGKDIIMICLNAECDAKRLCCLTCIDELHRKHELISLYKFESMLSVLTSSASPDIKSEVISRIKQFELGLFSSLDKLLEDFSKGIERSKHKIREALKLTYDSLNFEYKVNVVDEFYQNFTNTGVCKFLDLIKKVESEAFKDIESTNKILTTVHTNFDKQILQIQKNQIKQVQDINKAIDRLKTALSLGTSVKKRLFSKINKAVSIAVNQERDIAKREEGAGGYPIVLIEEALTEANDNVNVTLKEQPGNKGAWLGVCAIEVVKNFNFSSCYGMGKGTWAIDQVGASHQSSYSWNHHDSNYNSQPKVGWQFITGDTVNIRVDFSKSVVIFTRGTDKYEQPIKLDLGDIHAFVGCTHLNDTWAIA